MVVESKKRPGPGDLEGPNPNEIIPKRNIHILKDEICSAFGIDRRELEGTCKRKTFVMARKVFAAKARLECGSSLSEIGHALGDRDHTTIMYYLESFKRLSSKKGEEKQ